MKRLVLMIIPTLICCCILTNCASDKAVTQEWWKPILQKHNLKLGASNNFDNIFEMGMEGNSINNGICTLKVATVLIKYNDKSYIIVEADSIYHNINEDTFDIMSGTVKLYNIDDDLSSPSIAHMNATRMTLGGYRKNLAATN